SPIPSNLWMLGGSLRTIRAQALPSWPAQLRRGIRIEHSETTVMLSIAEYFLVRSFGHFWARLRRHASGCIVQYWRVWVQNWVQDLFLVAWVSKASKAD